MWTDLKSICPTRVESDPTETEWIPRAAAKVPQAAADHFDWILKGWLRLLLLPTWRDSSSSKSTLFCTLTRTRAKHTHSLNLPISCAHAQTHAYTHTLAHSHTRTHNRDLHDDEQIKVCEVDSKWRPKSGGSRPKCSDQDLFFVGKTFQLFWVFML